MSRGVEYETTTAGREPAGVAQSILGRSGDAAELSAAQVAATLAIYEVLADIASELTYMRKLSQEQQR